jgi:hypothetical protein
MPVTPNHDLPYPTPDDPVSLGAADIRALAEAVDTLAELGYFVGPLPTLTTTASIYASGDLVARLNAAGQVGVGVSGPSGEAGLSFGSAVDTMLYRAGPNTLRTPGAVVVDNNIYIDGPDTGRSVIFGSAQDAFIYRVAAGTLQTERLRVSSAGVAEESGLELFIDGAWRRVRRRSDGVMIC